MAVLVKMVGTQASIACFYYLRCSAGELGWGVILSLDSSFIPVLTWWPFSSLPDPAGSIETGSDQSEKAPGSASQVWYCRSFWCWWGPVDSHFGMILLYAQMHAYINIIIVILQQKTIEYGWNCHVKDLCTIHHHWSTFFDKNRDISRGTSLRNSKATVGPPFGSSHDLGK